MALGGGRCITSVWAVGAHPQIRACGEEPHRSSLGPENENDTTQGRATLAAAQEMRPSPGIPSESGNR